MKAKLTILMLLILCCAAYGQNITNTLGNEGMFTIKDNTTTFLSLNQLNGLINITNNINLAHTTGSQIGVIYKDNVRFIHNFMKPGSQGNNIFIGISSGNFSMSHVTYNYEASYNTALGNLSLSNLTSGYYNTGIGLTSLFRNTTGSNNTAVGSNSLHFNTTGNENTANGHASLYLNTTGVGNTAIGFESLFFNSIGNLNIAVGSLSLRSNTTGENNTATGSNSLRSNTTGNGNTAIGYSSLRSNTIGLHNTAIGNEAGYNITVGNNLTCIGNNSQPSTGNATNQITLGNNQITSLRCNVQTITSLSDMRDKRNINALSLGLDFIMKLKPRQFNWDKREWYEDGNADGSRMEEKPTAGFIAQELDEAQMSEDSDWLKLVLKDNPEKLEATPGNLLPIIVKAIQDLKSENDELKNENGKLTAKIESFKEINEKISTIEKMNSELFRQIEMLKSGQNDSQFVNSTVNE